MGIVLKTAFKNNLYLELLPKSVILNDIHKVQGVPRNMTVARRVERRL